MKRLSSRAERLAQLAQNDFDVGCLHAASVDFDLSTDSWNQLHLPAAEARIESLRARAESHPLDLAQALPQAFPFRHFITTPRGRDAEGLLFTALAQPDSMVVQNILFHTAREHQQRQGMLPLELPVPNAFTTDVFPFKGNLDLVKLEQALNTRKVSVVFIEALSNGVGGHPISLANLRSVKALAQTYGVPVYLDATRAVENCLLIREREPEFAGHDLLEIMRTFFSCCDGMTLSLVKDFGVIQGGLLATNSDALFFRARDSALRSEVILGEDEQALIAQAALDWEYVETQVQTRMRQVQALTRGLKSLGFPVRTPAGGHCVILDLAIPEGAPTQPFSIQSYLAWFYEHTGMRGAPHWSGLAPQYQCPLWLRLAVPVGLTEAHLHALLRRIALCTPLRS